ncbi:MAG: rhodanese-like domain-containing protein [Desulfovibrionaceae bacterium]
MSRCPGRLLATTLCVVLCCVSGLLQPRSAEAQNEFPLRPFYPSVTPISVEELLEVYGQAILVDVRTKFEFDVARINKAVNLPLGGVDLPSALARLRGKAASAPLVFYCNDPACSRAFRAAQEAVSEGWKNVYVFDAGVFAFIGAAPEKATLMGNSPADLERVIPPQAHRDRLLSYADFEKEALSESALVIDIRDVSRREYEPRLDNVRKIAMESLLEAVTNRVWAEKRLLLFDADGEQVRWLHYFLQANGYFDYAFLDSGVNGLDRAREARPVGMDTANVTLSQHQLQRLVLDSGLGDLERRLAGLIIGRLRFDNYAMLTQDEAQTLLDVTPEMLQAASDRLSDQGVILHTRVDDFLVFRINPRLAWKGEMEGQVWMGRVREFEKALQR